ncbi:unnamed protein product [Acanthosepion pharaonis]|uniref:Uncharacterized protein n=1 Tax=Acanthosepion pharaonis TaxID=158019 RepID=A0A812BFK3_ACAPH|nr:unnamed protein product [Sepia pharaonis]
MYLVIFFLRLFVFSLFLPSFLSFFLSFVLSFFLPFLLSFFRSFFLSSFLSFFLSIFHFFLSFFLCTCVNSCIIANKYYLNSFTLENVFPAFFHSLSHSCIPLSFFLTSSHSSTTYLGFCRLTSISLREHSLPTHPAHQSPLPSFFPYKRSNPPCFTIYLSTTPHSRLLLIHYPCGLRFGIAAVNGDPTQFTSPTHFCLPHFLKRL